MAPEGGTHLPPYQYAPLTDPKSNLRLLNVKHATQERIECSFTHVSSPSDHKYNCLSYTWNDPFGRATTKIARTIHIIHEENGVKVVVGTLNINYNLHDALVHLFRFQQDKLQAIWIDALCINQGDDVEKGHQIKIMDQIYSGAELVVIWLGPEDPNKPGSNEKVQEVARRIRETAAMSAAAAVAEPNNKRDGALNELGINLTSGPSLFDELLKLNDGVRAEAALEAMPLIRSIDSEHWAAVFNLSDRAYWSRLWIWQEVLASKRDPIVVCGDSVFTWEDIRATSHFFTTFGSGAMISVGQPMAHAPDKKPRNRPHQIAHWRDSYLDPPDGSSSGPAWMRLRFGRLVFDTNRNGFECYDERDKIYAHMGLCRYEKLDDWDYAVSFWDLYRELWFEIMERTRCINFLTFVEDASARQARPKTMKHDLAQTTKKGYIPTWVPDLRTRLEPISMWTEFQFNKDFDISRNFDRGDKRADIDNGLRVDRASGRLHLRGIMLDIVAQFGECREELASQASLPGMLELIKTILEPSTKSPYSHPREAMDAVLSSIMLMTLSRTSEGEDTADFPVPLEERERCKGWLLHSLAYSEIIMTHNYCTERQKALLTELEATDTAGAIPPREKVAQYAERYKRRTRDLVRLSHANATDHDESQTVGCLMHQRTSSNEGDYIGMAAVAAGDAGISRMRLFRTGEQGWVGKGSQSLRVGDEVWIFPGAEVAFILRKWGIGERYDGSRRLYVGHAYVHGLMSGEGREYLSSRKLDEITLE